MAVTIRDVARVSGVHVSTVSRTLSAAHLVSPDTRARVLAAADALGYRPNRAARALSTSRTGNLGLIVADIANPFFPPLVKSAQAQARERDYHVFVADTDERPEVEEELVRSMAKQVDGVLLVAPRLANRVIAELSRELPLVVVNRRLRGVPGVLMDVGSGARQALDHLLGLGHREIALATGPHTAWTSREIERAAEGLAAERGVLLQRIGPNPPTEEGGRSAAEEVAASGASAVLAHNDLMAFGLVRQAAGLGLSVPGDLSVVGVDNSHVAQYCSPALTTVEMPVSAAGRGAVDLLLQAVGAGDPPGTVSLETGLVVRESTAPPRGVGAVD
ncbi:LacI family transcriptional regulator [Nocardiopsis terrae]|uniref:LacI family transcriptional regulator n=1 Tax=Nocardiopsis terrae TaxID=372655 RepID=A0ABR9HMV8_9ACTN|nr:LacI family DNA-binding transcriptional regulator [Nocardiopsis terrae]MBE1460288.1 LacI family transcriptional regulator [Nocardiopsis terrae]GHC70670.1 LacI family transcriptional regulator [Nocardiopsis terrae]